MPSYRLKSPIVGVEHSSTGMLIIYVEPGAILGVADTDQEAGLVDTTYRGRTLAVFLEDLRERAEPADEVRTPSPEPSPGLPS